MTKKTMLGIAVLAAMVPALLPAPARATVNRVSLVEDFGFFT